MAEPGVIDEVVRHLDFAREKRAAIDPLSDLGWLSSPALAYEIQTQWTRFRGERVLGHKIGLTSQAMRDQIGVGEPDYGRLWESRFFPAADGVSRIPADTFLQPRVEGELAFHLSKALSGPDVDIGDVLAATDAIAPSVEVIDSRITDWKIRLVDTIADNASFGAFTVGPWDTALVHADLRTLGMLLQRNGTAEVAAVGFAALGHPAASVAWLARALDRQGVSLSAGDIVLSGALGASVPAARGDEFTVEVHGQPPLTVFFD